MGLRLYPGPADRTGFVATALGGGEWDCVAGGELTRVRGFALENADFEIFLTVK
jgi:hypothetical protein